MSLTGNQKSYFEHKRDEAKNILREVSYISSDFFGLKERKSKTVPFSSLADLKTNVYNYFATIWNTYVELAANIFILNDDNGNAAHFKSIRGDHHNGPSSSFCLELLAKTIYYLAQAGEFIADLFCCGGKKSEITVGV